MKCYYIDYPIVIEGNDIERGVYYKLTRFRKGSLMGKANVSGQDDTGRFYYSSKERDRPGGRMIEIYLTLIRKDDEIGHILVRDRWIHGGINFHYMGPKKWVKYLEKNLDSILDKAVKHFRKTDSTYELVAVEGWRIIDKKITSTHNMFYADTSPGADPTAGLPEDF